GIAAPVATRLRARPFSRRSALLEAAKPSVEIEIKENEQSDADEPVREEVVRSVVALEHRLADMAVGGAKHEQRPAKPGGEPEQAADPDAQEAENAPRAVMQSDLELKRAPRRPT